MKNSSIRISVVILGGIFICSLVGCDAFQSIKENLFGSKKKEVKSAPVNAPVAIVSTAKDAPTPLAKSETPPPTSSVSDASVSTPVENNQNNILARVGSWTITKEAFADRLKALKEVAPDFDVSNVEAKKLVLNELVRQELLVQEAQSKGIDKQKDVLNAFEEFKRTLLVRQIATELTKDIAVSDDEIKNFYEANKAILVKPFQWRVSEIVMADQVKANEVLTEVLKGSDFAETAKVNSQDKSAANGGDLGFLTQEPFPAMVNALVPLKVGEVSSVFKGPQGYYIIKLTEKKGGELIPLDEIKEDIKQNQMSTKQQKIILEHLAELEKKTKVEINEGLLP